MQTTHVDKCHYIHYMLQHKAISCYKKIKIINGSFSLNRFSLNCKCFFIIKGKNKKNFEPAAKVFLQSDLTTKVLSLNYACMAFCNYFDKIVTYMNFI